MIKSIVWLIRGFLALSNPNKWKFFKQAYKSTKFDSAFIPSWSQAGEDIALLSALVKSTNESFYLDIGAHDPNRFSVTRKLYDLGWRGIDIDANSSFEREFQRFRPENLFLNCCVGIQEEYRFTIFSEGAISTTKEEWIGKFKAEGNQVLKEVVVPGKTLREIIDLPGVPKCVDFINIDIEGADEEALRSIMFENLPRDRYPKWVLLETTPPVSSSLNFPAVRYALEHGYTPWLVLPMATLLKAPAE